MVDNWGVSAGGGLLLLPGFLFLSQGLSFVVFPQNSLVVPSVCMLSRHLHPPCLVPGFPIALEGRIVASQRTVESPQGTNRQRTLFYARYSIAGLRYDVIKRGAKASNVEHWHREENADAPND